MFEYVTIRDNEKDKRVVQPFSYLVLVNYPFDVW